MLSMLKEIFAIVRPSGLKRLGAVLAVTVLQALFQTGAVFSLMPFLSAVADINRFRKSTVGHVFLSIIGNNNGDQRVMLYAGMASLMFLIAGNAVTLFADNSRANYAFSLAQDLRVSLAEKIFSRRYAYFLGVNSSVLVKHLMDDVGKVAAELVLPALDLGSRCLILAFMAASVLIVEPWIVLGAIIFVIIYNLIVMSPIRSKSQANSEKIREGFRRLYLEVFQSLGGIKQIIATGRSEYFVKRIGRASHDVTRAMAKVHLYAAMPRSGFEVLVFGGMIVWVMVSIIAGQNLVTLLPRIGFVALVAYRVTPSLQLIFAQASLMNSARQALDEVTALLNEQKSWSAGGRQTSIRAVVDRPNATWAWSREIRFENVSFCYDGADRVAIRGISFAIKKGARVAFIGPTGSGKSTVVDLLMGLLMPTSGKIYIDDVPLTPENVSVWRQTIGYMPQELFLLDGTIAENVAFGIDLEVIDRGRVLDVAEIAQARNFIETEQPHGIDTVVGERGVRLSGGQRQRLALARALYLAPNVLIMDEATSALDPVTELKVTEAIQRDGNDVTIITVAHRMSTIRSYDAINYLEDGKIILSGSYDSLLETEARFQEFIRGAA